MRSPSRLSYLGAFAWTLGGLASACRGNLPPTEPPRVVDEGLPGASANGNDAPLLALAGPGPVAAGSGGTGALPIPPPGPGGGGMGGAAPAHAP